MFVFVSLLLLAGLLYTLISRRRKVTLPFPMPADGRQFVLGHYESYLRQDRLQLRVEKLHREFGGIIQLDAMGIPLVFLGSYEALHEMLVKRGKDFSGRPSLARWDVWAGGKGGESGIMMSNPDPTWKILRTTAHAHIKSYDKGLKRVEEVSNDVSADMMAELLSHGGEPFDPKEVILRTVLNMTAVFLCGRKFDVREGIFTGLLSLEDRMVKAFGAGRSGFLFDLMPWTSYVGNPTERRMKGLKQEWEGLYERIKSDIAERGDDSGDGEKECLFSALLNKSDQLDGGEKRTKLAVIDIIMGGLVTTTNTFYACLNILTHHPDVYANLIKEVDTVLGPHRQPTLDDRPQMPYLRAFLFELLRYTTVQPIGDHTAMVDTQLGGVPIPRGTYVVASYWSLHHDPDLYPDPLTFRPERFLDDDGDLVSASHPNRRHMFPFGAGPRVCIGEVFALARLFLIIAKTLQRFTPVQDGEKVTCDPRNYTLGGILYPPRFKIRMVERNQE